MRVGIIEPLRVQASMRPRLITAENPKRAGQPSVIRAASMRPRLITAENLNELIERNEGRRKLQ